MNAERTQHDACGRRRACLVSRPLRWAGYGTPEAHACPPARNMKPSCVETQAAPTQSLTSASLPDTATEFGLSGVARNDGSPSDHGSILGEARRGFAA